MVVSLKTDLRFPIPGQQGHGDRIIQLTKKDAETLKKISNTKQEIFCKGETEGLLYAMKLGTLLKKYINSVDQTDLVEDIRVS